MFNVSFLIVCAVIFGLCLLNIPVIQTLWRHSFDDGTYSHAYLIPFITLYLYAQLAKNNMLEVRNKISLIWLLLLTLSAIGFYLSVNAQLSLGYWVCFLGLLTLSLLNVFRFSLYTVFPVIFLIFIFPLWGNLTLLLQDLSVFAVSVMMGFTGIATYVEAPFVHIPAGTFEIAHGCSGLRYVIVSLAISSLFIFLYIKDRKKALLFFTIALLGGLLTNWLRITALILIGHYTDMTSSLMYDHNSFGWYIYMPFMVLLFILGNKLADTDLTKAKPDNTAVKVSLCKTNLILVTLVGVITSTSAALISFPSAQTPTATDPAQTANIMYAKSVELQQFESLGLSAYVYSYTPADLDSKPTFYANELIVKDWFLVKSEQQDDHQLLFFQKGRHKAVAALAYKFDKLVTGNSKQFKIARLKQAYKGKQNTQLIWMFEPCQAECTEITAKMKQYIATL